MGGWVGGWVSCFPFFFPSRLGGGGVCCAFLLFFCFLGFGCGRWLVLWLPPSAGGGLVVVVARCCWLRCVACCVVALPGRSLVRCFRACRRRSRCSSFCCCCLPFCCCCCCWCCRSSSASPSCGGRFPPRHDFSAGPCQATSSLPLGLPPPPNFDNIVLTHPFSAPISAFGPSVSSVLSCSGHGTAQRTHHPATRGALLWCLPFFFLFPLLFVSCLLVAAPF